MAEREATPMNRDNVSPALPLKQPPVPGRHEEMDNHAVNR